MIIAPTRNLIFLAIFLVFLIKCNPFLVQHLTYYTRFPAGCIFWEFAMVGAKGEYRIPRLIHTDGEATLKLGEEIKSFSFNSSKAVSTSLVDNEPPIPLDMSAAPVSELHSTSLLSAMNCQTHFAEFPNCSGVNPQTMFCSSVGNAIFFILFEINQVRKFAIRRQLYHVRNL